MQTLQHLPEEVRAIITRVTRLYERFLKPDLTCLLLEGPAVSGGVIPGFSVLTFRAYLEAESLESGAPPFDLGIALQREMLRADIQPFASVCSFFEPATADAWRPPVPGSYLVLSGTLPGPDATAEILGERAVLLRQSIGIEIESLRRSLANFDTADTLGRTRVLVSNIFAVFPALISQADGDVLAAMSLTLPAQVERLATIAPELRVKPFLLAIARAGSQSNAANHLHVIEQALPLLDDIRLWIAKQH